jgi:hypothetical protein
MNFDDLVQSLVRATGLDPKSCGECLTYYQYDFVKAFAELTNGD